MFNGKFTLLIALLAAVLMSGCSLMYYSDSEDAPGGDPSVSSGSSENISDDLPTVPEALFRDTVTVSEERLMEIHKGMTCSEVVGILGETQSFGRTGYRQYVTEDGRVIQFRFDSNNDSCPYSGGELHLYAAPLNYSEELPDGTAYGVLVNYGGFVTFGTGETDGAELLIDNAEIVFEDGSAAKKQDLIPKTPLLITRDKVIPGTIEQWHCTKIVILPMKTVYASEYEHRFDVIPVNTPYGELLEILEDIEISGDLKQFDITGYVQFITNEHRVIPLRFDSLDDLCPYSGAELYKRSLPLYYDGTVPEDMTFGVLAVVDGEMLFTYYSAVDDGSELEMFVYNINTAYLAADDAEIIFEDGAPASAEDFDPETMVFVQYDNVSETDLGEMHCTKITILK